VALHNNNVLSELGHSTPNLTHILLLLLSCIVADTAISIQVQRRATRVPVSPLVCAKCHTALPVMPATAPEAAKGVFAFTCGHQYHRHCLLPNATTATTNNNSSSCGNSGSSGSAADAAVRKAARRATALQCHVCAQAQP
jgi:hypothetical protein